MELQTLEETARRLRAQVVRMSHRARSPHLGSSLSCIDILVAAYFSALRLDAERPQDPDRDRFILSKGHAGAGVYAALAERGFFPTEMLSQHYRNGSVLSGHVSHKGVPGVEFSTGSLGHGLGVGVGMAYAAQVDGKAHRVFVLMSDGECDEGSNWEAALFAAHHKLGNLRIVIDYNKIQSIKAVAETIDLEPFADKWRAFGWNVAEVDGHDHAALHDAFAAMDGGEQPHCLIAHTVKGKGVSFMEHQVLWHYRSPQGDEYAAAVRELDDA